MFDFQSFIEDWLIVRQLQTHLYVHFGVPEAPIPLLMLVVKVMGSFNNGMLSMPRYDISITHDWELVHGLETG